jgi:hypothetical protein
VHRHFISSWIILNIEGSSKGSCSWTWWYMSAIPVLRKLRLEDLEFEPEFHSEFQASKGYIERPCLKKSLMRLSTCCLS